MNFIQKIVANAERRPGLIALYFFLAGAICIACKGIDHNMMYVSMFLITAAFVFAVKYTAKHTDTLNDVAEPVAPIFYPLYYVVKPFASPDVQGDGSATEWQVTALGAAALVLFLVFMALGALQLKNFDCFTGMGGVWGGGTTYTPMFAHQVPWF